MPQAKKAKKKAGKDPGKSGREIVSFFEKKKPDKMIQLSDLMPNPENPRFIRDENFKRLKAKIKKRPHFLKFLPIIYDDSRSGIKKGMIISGNQRFEVLKDLGFKEIPEEWTRKASELSPEEESELILWANQHEGEYDFDRLANLYDPSIIDEAGIYIPGTEIFTGPEMNPNNLSDEFSLNDGDKAPFQTMSFTFANLQADAINNAIEEAKASDDFQESDKFGNESTPGNALYFIVDQWLQQKISSSK